MESPAAATEYSFADACESHVQGLFAPPILERIGRWGSRTVLDLGCGNGALSRLMADKGCEVRGIDPSASGIEQARKAHPDIEFEKMSVYDPPPAGWMESFDVVVSTEVVEHLYSPREFPKFIRQVLKPGGRAIITTPYHGYLKNLALSVMGAWDKHHTALWDHGHIKFWSRRTLSQLFTEQGFQEEDFVGLGRFPGLWKTMLIVFRKGG